MVNSWDSVCYTACYTESKSEELTIFSTMPLPVLYLVDTLG